MQIVMYGVPSLKESSVSRVISGDSRDCSGVVSPVICVRSTRTALADFKSVRDASVHGAFFSAVFG